MCDVTVVQNSPNFPGPPAIVSFGLNVRNDFANIHDGFVGNSWTWDFGGLINMSDQSLTLDANVPPLSFSGGIINLSATSTFGDGFSHTANFVCQVFKFQTFSSPEGEPLEEEKPADYAFVTFPNPSTGSFQIQLNVQEQTPLIVQVLDTSGEEVYSFKEAKAEGMFLHEVDLGKVKPGVYFLKFVTDSATSTQRIIID